MKSIVMLGMMSCAQVLLGVVSPLQRFHSQMQSKYRGQFTREVIDGFCDMEIIRPDSARQTQKWFGAEALAWYRDFGNYALVPAIGQERCGDVMRRLAAALDGEWMSYWNALGIDAREALLRNPDRLVPFVEMVVRTRADDPGGVKLQFLRRHPNALAYLDEYPELLYYDDAVISSVACSLDKLSYAKMTGEQRTTVRNSLKERELVSMLARDGDLSGRYGDLPLLLFLAEPRLFSKLENDCDLEDRIRERMMIVSSHIDYFISRRAVSGDWTAEVDDYVRIFTYEPKRAELTRMDWVQLLLSCSPESGKLMPLLRCYLHQPNKFETVERIAVAMKRDMKRYPPSDLCVLLRLIREGSLIDDFEALVRICLDAGMKVDPKSGCRYPGVMLILSGVPDDPDFMDYLNRERFGMRLIAYLGNYEYGRDIQERWGRAKLNKLEDAAYDDGQAKEFINKIPCVGSLANVGVKLVKGYPVTTAEYICAGIDAASIVLSVVTAGSSSAGTAAAKETVKRTTKVVAEKTTKEIVKQKMVEAAGRAARETIQAYTKNKLKEFAAEAGEYIDKHGDEMKEMAGKLDEIRKSLAEESNVGDSSDHAKGLQRGAGELLAVFGRAFPIRQHASAAYVDRRGISCQIESPSSSVAWKRSFDECNDILLVSIAE